MEEYALNTSQPEMLNVGVCDDRNITFLAFWASSRIL